MMNLDVSESITLKEAQKGEKSRNVLWNFFLVLIAVNIFTAIFGIIVMIPIVPKLMENGISLENLESDATLMCVMLFATIFEILIPIWYCLKKEKRNLRSLGFSKDKKVSNYIIGYLIGIFLLTVVALVTVATGAASINVNSDISYLWIFAFFIGFLIQGAAEEVLLRGHLLVSLTNKHSVTISVLLSSLIFSAMHLGNPGFTFLAFVNITLFGIFMALLFLRTDNIWIVCAVHSAWNFFQGHIFGVQVSGMSVTHSIFNFATTDSLSIINGGAFGLEGGIVTTIVLAISIVLTLVIKKSKNNEVEA